jgi:ADP-ribose pyrophosphatase YjhB (NUDIX family)
MLTRDTFCSYCGTKYPEPLTYPRTCTSCQTSVWANPIPVCVALVPIVTAEGTGLLTVRRAIPPGIGKLALVGGFLEEHESWEVGMAREVLEETGVIVDPGSWRQLWWSSSSPKPNRVLLFAVSAELRGDQLPPFTPDSETAARGVVFGPAGLDDEFAFSLHVEAARKYFAAAGIDRPHGFREI